jgi:cardiolipin synthase
MKKFLAGNRITLLKNGAEYFPALEAAIDGAKQSIYLETYIYRNDETGRRVAQALVGAAQRGVEVHVLIDGFGSRPLPAHLLRAMDVAGVQVRIYRREVSRWRLRRHRLRRMHRKLVLIDQQVAFVGGINIRDDVDRPGEPPQYDYAVSVEGPLIRDVHVAVHRLWNIVSWAALDQPPHLTRPAEPMPAAAGSMRAQFLLRDNLRNRRKIERAYLRAIGKAHKEILLANAYFLPGTRFRRALIAAVARGVRVIVLVQGRTDHPMANYAKQALCGHLLESGVEIYEYNKSLLHAKVAVIDGVWATVGSSNIDPFSLLLSREANVVAYERQFAEELRASILEEIRSGAVRVYEETWRKTPMYRRFLIWVSYGIVRLMMGMVGYSHSDPMSSRKKDGLLAGSNENHKDVHQANDRARP